MGNLGEINDCSDFMQKIEVAEWEKKSYQTKASIK